MYLTENVFVEEFAKKKYLFYFRIKFFVVVSFSQQRPSHADKTM